MVKGPDGQVKFFFFFFFKENLSQCSSVVMMPGLVGVKDYISHYSA